MKTIIDKSKLIAKFILLNAEKFMRESSLVFCKVPYLRQILSRYARNHQNKQ